MMTTWNVACKHDASTTTITSVDWLDLRTAWSFIHSTTEPLMWPALHKSKITQQLIVMAWAVRVLIPNSWVVGFANGVVFLTSSSWSSNDGNVDPSTPIFSWQRSSRFACDVPKTVLYLVCISNFQNMHQSDWFRGVRQLVNQTIVFSRVYLCYTSNPQIMHLSDRSRGVH